MAEYYTPRPLIRAMVETVKPQIGETIYDPAVGSAGFLCEAFTYMRKGDLSTDDLSKLETTTLYGKEKKSLAYVIGVMNMILHGVEAPNIIHTNTLSENISDIQEKNRYDVILANRPSEGKNAKKSNKTSRSKPAKQRSCSCNTSSNHQSRRTSGHHQNTFLSNSDNAAIS